jgi:VanZ family protein
MKYPTIIISVLIIVAVLIPGSNLPDVSMVGFDKIVHIAMFTLWALAVRYDFNSPSFNAFIVFLLGVCFSVLTEALQLMVEGRSFDLYDMIADGTGLLLGLLISGWVLKLLRRY